MFSKIAGFFLALILATPAIARPPAYTGPTDRAEDVPPPPNSVGVDVPAINPELPEDRRWMGDVLLGVGAFGIDDQAAVGGSVGAYAHLRLSQYVSLMFSAAFGGGGFVTDPEQSDYVDEATNELVTEEYPGTGGTYTYAFGVGVSLRTFGDSMRALLAVEFVGMRTSADDVLAHGVAFTPRIEFQIVDHLLLQVGARVGPGWDIDGNLGVLWGPEVGFGGTF